jgi:CRISPR/Cas system CSM-associated protein Csm3 (group 7 of RAMP superfamily)
VTAPVITFVTFDLVLEDHGGVGVPGTVEAPAPRADAQARATTGTELDVSAGDGAPLVPGSSLAGALRELVAARHGGDRARRWFGSIRSDRPDGGDETAEPDEDLPDPGTVNDLRETPRPVDAEASRLWVLDAAATADAATETLTSTAVDRDTGSARNRTLRSETVALPGARFTATLRWDDASEADRALLLDALAGWRPLLGRGVSRGRGRCRVTDLRYGTCDLGSATGLRQWLTLDGTRLAAEVARTAWPPEGTAVTAAAPTELCRVPLTITGPLHVGTGAPRRGDGHDLQVVRRGPDGPLVPGTALKGVLRSRVEFILRSVGADPTPCRDASCGQCVPCRLFGFTLRRPAAGGSVGRRSALRVLDAPVRTRTPVRQRQHVAIDRFTGGARDKLLFTMEAVEHGRFDLVIEDIGCREGDADLARALVRLVADDVRDGYLGVGAATTRGYGGLTCAEDLTGLPTSEQARAVLARAVGRAGREGDGDD